MRYRATFEFEIEEDELAYEPDPVIHAEYVAGSISDGNLVEWNFKVEELGSEVG